MSTLPQELMPINITSIKPTKPEEEFKKFTTPTQSTEPFVTTITKEGEVVVKTRTQAEVESQKPPIPLDVKMIPPAALLYSVSPVVPTTKEEKVGFVKYELPATKTPSLAERAYYGAYGVAGTLGMASPAVLTYIVPSVALSTGLGAGLRFLFSLPSGYEKAKEEALKPSEIKSDIMTGVIMGPIGMVVSPLLRLPTPGYVRFFTGGTLATAGTFLKDVGKEMAEGKEPEVSYSPLVYLGSYLFGGSLAYGIPLWSEAVRTGKMWTIKPGYVKGSEEERWLGIYYQRGPKAKPLIGVMLRKTPEGMEIEFGKELKFEKFVPGVTPYQSPIETALSWDALKNYYKDLADKGLLKGSLKPEELKAFIDIIADYYRYGGKESVKVSLLEVLQRAERLKDMNIEELHKFITSYTTKGNAVLYGSGSLEMLIGKYLLRETHDLDLQLLRGSSKDFVEKFLEKFGRENFIVKEVEHGHQIYNKAGEKIMEVFNPEYGYLLKQKYLGYGFAPLSPQETSEGLIMQLKETAARKLAAGFSPTEKGITAAEEKWIKHQGDYIAILNFLRNNYAFLRPKIDAVLENPNASDLLKSLVKDLKSLNVVFVVGSKTYTPSEVASSLPSIISSLASSLASASSPSVSKKDTSQPSVSVSTSQSTSISQPSPSGSSDSSYKYRYTYYSYSPSFSSYSIPPSSPPSYYYYYSSPPPQTPRKSPPLLPPPPVGGLPSFNPPAPRIVVPTRVVSELSYI